MVLVPVMAAYNGFQSLGCIGEEVTNPQKNIPRAAIFGSLVVISLYMPVNWTYFRVLGLSRVAQSHHVASDTMVQLIGNNGAKWITVGMIISALGALHSNFLAYPQIPFAMARDGYFFAFAKRVQPLYRSPSGAIFFQACVAVLLVLTGTYQELYSFEMFAIWLFFALTAIALIRLGITEPELPRSYRVWGYPWTVLVFGIAGLFVDWHGDNLARSAVLLLLASLRARLTPSEFQPNGRKAKEWGKAVLAEPRAARDAWSLYKNSHSPCSDTGSGRVLPRHLDKRTPHLARAVEE